MPKSKTEMMARLRQQRKDAGLVEFRVWVTPEQSAKLFRYLVSIESNKVKSK